MGDTNLQYDNSTSNLKNQKRPTDTESEKLLSKITGISLEFILIYTFAGLLIILGTIQLAVCINNYRKKGNRSTKRCV